MFKKIFLGLLISGQSSGLLLSKPVEPGVYNPFHNIPNIHDKISSVSYGKQIRGPCKAPYEIIGGLERLPVR